MGVLLIINAIGKNKENTEIKSNTETTKITITPTGEPTSDFDKLFSVVRIIDGDTLVVKIDNKDEVVRLIGIDAPETKDSRKPIQCFGKEATERAKELMENKKVKLEADGS